MNNLTLSHSCALSRIPVDQLDDFTREKAGAKKQVLDWVSVLDPLLDIRGREKLYPQIARQMGVSSATAKRKFLAWKKGVEGVHFPAWEKLVDRAKYKSPNLNRGLPEAFLQYWKKTREDQKRRNDGGKQAHRELIRQLDAWHTEPENHDFQIPGYSEPPALDSFCSYLNRKVPDGWSYSNLQNHRPSDLNLTNIIIGKKAAADFLPSNLGTRAGLRYREILLTDDQDYDNDVVAYKNKAKPMRPQGFNVLDYLTANFETYCLQLRHQDEESGVKRGINQELYVWTVLHDLMSNGFRTDKRGTRIIREHATAKGYTKKDLYGDSFDDVLAAITDGQVTMDASGRFDQPLFASLYLGSKKQSAGNFRYKAPLESAFHRVRTEMAGFLGDTGNRYQVNPEQNAEIDKYTRKLWKWIDEKPAAEREEFFRLLRFPKHTFRQFSQFLGTVYQLVNGRTDHDLEGWSECDFVLPGYAVQDEENPNRPPRLYTAEMVAELDPRKRHWVESWGEHRNIILSPAQAAQIERRRDRNITRLTPERAALALPRKWAYPTRRGESGGIKVKSDGTFRILDKARFGDSALVYIALIKKGNHEILLRPGTQYLLHICPFNPSRAIVLDMDERFLGTVELLPRVRANDVETRMKQQGIINEYEATATRFSRLRQQPEVERREAEVHHNERVMKGEIIPTDSDLQNAAHEAAQNAVDDANDRGQITPDFDAEEPAADTSVFHNIFANNPDLDN